MGYRPNLVENYQIKYGDQINGFNHSFDEFVCVLDELQIDYSIENEYKTIDIAGSDVAEKLKNADLENLLESKKRDFEIAFDTKTYEQSSWDMKKEIVANLVKILVKGLDTAYCKRTGYIKIDWA